VSDHTVKIPARDVRPGDFVAGHGVVKRAEKVGAHHVRLHFQGRDTGYARTGYMIEYALSERVEVEG